MGCIFLFGLIICIPWKLFNHLRADSNTIHGGAVAVTPELFRNGNWHAR